MTILKPSHNNDDRDAARCDVRSIGLRIGRILNSTFPVWTTKNHNDRYWVEKGEELVSYRKYPEALDCFNQAIEMEPNNAKAWYGKAIVENDTHQPQAALNSVNEALKNDGENPNYHLLKELISDGYTNTGKT